MKKIWLDANHLLCISNSNLPQLKPYHYQLGGYRFESWDQEILAYHKRARKFINLKNLGDGMQVCYSVLPQMSLDFSFDPQWLLNALVLFPAFNEETGEYYHFLPHRKGDLSQINQLLDRLQLSSQLLKTPQATVIQGVDRKFTFPASKEGKIWLLFSLTLLYGSWTLKNNELQACKLHFPLLGNARQREEQLLGIMQDLHEEGLFVHLALQDQHGKTMLQGVCTDPDLLTLFARWRGELGLATVQSETPHSLHAKHQELKTQLRDFILAHEEIGAEKSDFLAGLQAYRFRFLK